MGDDTSLKNGAQNAIRLNVEFGDGLCEKTGHE
jgi:hypothetical protein